MCEEDSVSGIAESGTRPCLATSATNMFHCPPSSDGVESRCATVRSSTSRSRVSSTDSRKWLAFSILSQNSRWFWENSKSLTPSRAAVPVRSRLSPANSQQRPLFFWSETFRSVSRWDTVVSMEVTTPRSSATSVTGRLDTAFCISRFCGEVVNSLA